MTIERLIPILFRAMALLLGAGLAGAFAAGFGVAIPTWAIVTAIAGGTIAMVALFAALAMGMRRVASTPPGGE